MPLITVFTPAYNRALKLKRAYDSLKRQTCKDFCWLIVDDGSTDDTEEAVRSFREEGLVDIKYMRRENGGKMRAHNSGVKETETELFVCLDSDDYLSDDAVEVIIRAWNGIDDKDHYAGIIAYKGEDEENPIYGNLFPYTADCSFRELYQKGFKGETTLVFRTELLKANLFPEIEGEKYVPEDVVYDRIDEGHIYKIIPSVLTICEIVKDGYTDRAEKLRREAPTGWFIYYYQRALSWPVSLLKFKFASHYLRFSPLADKAYSERFKLPVLLAVAGFPGYLVLCLRNKL
ncbi:MAG: glycosyltransferase family 2 protein [Lachnospiraceae bacterium]|nr:glycosyltransferase family 2 protein [Lachnospiraceae bacterium]